jgi:hypothetical protein
VMIMKRQPDLLQMILALHPPSCHPGRLHCGQQKTYQNANDRNHHKQFNKRKSVALTPEKAVFAHCWTSNKTILAGQNRDFYRSKNNNELQQCQVATEKKIKRIPHAELRQCCSNDYPNLAIWDASWQS